MSAEPLAKALFFARLLPAILRAAARLAFLERRLTLEQLAERLRAVPPLRARRLRNPAWVLASVDRLLPLLPPRRYGRCLRRSLLLLDLWSRCELSPRLHLGVRRAADAAHEGHAWVTSRRSDGAEGPATSADGYPEAFEL